MREKLAIYVLLAVTLCYTACHKPTSAAEAEEEDVETAVVITGDEPFRNGDLVFRCGHGIESNVVTMSSNSIYSHVGMLWYDEEQAQWHVIHAVPGEVPYGEPEYLKNEPLSEFYSTQRAINGAWARIDCPDSIAEKAAAYCLRKYEEHVIFDNDYLLGDTTQLYCCELVWQAYRHQGIDISSGQRHGTPRVFCDEGECIYPEDIEKGEQTLFIKQFKTKKL